MSRKCLLHSPSIHIKREMKRPVHSSAAQPRPRWENLQPAAPAIRVGGLPTSVAPIPRTDQQPPIAAQPANSRQPKKVDAAAAAIFFSSLLRNEDSELVSRISGEYGTNAMTAYLAHEEGINLTNLFAVFAKDVFWVSSAEKKDIPLQDLSTAREWHRRAFLVKKVLSLQTIVNIIIVEDDASKLNFVKSLASLARHDNNRSVVDFIVREAQAIIRDKKEKLEEICRRQIRGDNIRLDKCLEIIEAIASDELHQATKLAAAKARSDVPRQAQPDSDGEETGEGEKKQQQQHGSTAKVDSDGFGHFHGQATYRRDPLDPTFFDMSHRPSAFNSIVTDAKIRSIEEHVHAVFAATREDAIGPLRDNINEYERYLKSQGRGQQASTPMSRQLRSVLYRDVRITNVVSHRFHGVCYELTFPKLEGVNWHRTKRLSPGSLLGLSVDQFRTAEQTFFGVVVDHNVGLLQQGMVIVAVKPSAGHPHGLLEAFDSSFDMIDSNVMWEATVHTLRSLQNNNLASFDALDALLCRPGANNSNKGKKEMEKLFMASLQLDPSQRKALDHCFAATLSCVQGPPGTGKTYVGVAVVRCALRFYNEIPAEWKGVPDPRAKQQAVLDRLRKEFGDGFADGFLERLLRGKKTLSDEDDEGADGEHSAKSMDLGPILLVTYTNHALDSMIRDVLAAEPSLAAAPGRLVRLGRQTRDSKIEPYLLGNTIRALGTNSLRKFPSYKCSEEVFLKKVEEFYEEEFPVATIASHDAELAETVAHLVSSLETVRSKLTDQIGELMNKSSAIDGEAADMQQMLNREQERLDVLLAEMKKAEVKVESDHIACGNMKMNIRRYEKRLETLDGDRQNIDRQIAKLADCRSHLLVTWRDEMGSLATAEDSSHRRGTQMPRIDEEEEELGVHEQEAAAELTDDPGVKRSAKVKKATALNRLMARVAGKPPAVLLSQQQLPNIHLMSAVDRHLVYGYLRHLHMKSMLKELRSLAEAFATSCTVLQAEECDNQVEILQRAKVIGVTTTGMSKFRDVIGRIPIRIVILEEAAEIPEAHALASLLPTVKMFVQVGDHQQLEPKTNCHKHSLDTRLNVSLMERLIRCKAVDYVTLTLQRRMRPEIARYIHPLYAERMRASGVERIEDHERTLTYPNLPGVPHRGNGSNVFFIEHAYEESGCDESATRQNPREAAFVAGLAIYFGQQAGYNSRVTVIAPYRGQVTCIRDALRRSKQHKSLSEESREKIERERAEAAMAKKRESDSSNSNNKQQSQQQQQQQPQTLLDTIRVVTVDDYQGEENDIIILSLTRSKSVGFLGKNNRVCVALSRARHGMVVVGFLELFRRARWTHWPYVLQLAASTQSLTTVGIPLLCKTHQTASIMRPRSDFVTALEQYVQSSPFGGCTQACEKRRPMCGHVCEHMCHGGECTDFACPRTVRKTFDCGHSREFACIDVYPKEDVSKVQCLEKCGAPLPVCGHQCSGTCSKCRLGWHKPSQQICGRTQACGHVCMDKCSTTCSPCTKDCES